MRISDWSSDVCSSDLQDRVRGDTRHHPYRDLHHDGGAQYSPGLSALHTHPQTDTVAGGRACADSRHRARDRGWAADRLFADPARDVAGRNVCVAAWYRSSVDARHRQERSEEHTSELQSLMRISYAVFCLQTKN